MREGWTLTPLATVTKQLIEPIDLRPDVEYRNLGVKWYAAGTFLREPKPGREIKANRLFRVRPGQFVYNRMFATEGSFALVRPEDAEAVASNEFPVFDVDRSRLLPEFLYLWFQQEAVWQEVNRQCTGTTKSRLRWKEERFRAFPLPLPPTAEQRRILDLFRALDEVIAAGQTSLSRCRSASILLLSQHKSDGPAVALEHVFSHILGGAWGDAPGVSDTAVLALGPRSYAGRIKVDPGAASPRSLSVARAAERVLRDGDIVLERSGGSPTQPVGRVIRMVGNSPSNIVASDFQRLLRPDPAVAEPAYVFWRMWLNYELGSPLPFQKATTSIRNLNIPAYLKHVRIEVPDRIEQTRFVELAESFAAAAETNSSVVSRLTDLRSDLLSALLSGAHEIPESYDKLIEVAS